MKACSYCGRESEDHLFYCRECGTPLNAETEAVQADDLNKLADIKFDEEMKSGAMWCIGGILVTALTYSSAAHSPSGGPYVIAYGAILAGGFRFLRGLLRISATGKRKLEKRDNDRAVRKTVGYQDTAYHATLQPEAHTEPISRSDPKS
jgi:hypothetical protein